MSSGAVALIAYVAAIAAVSLWVARKPAGPDDLLVGGRNLGAAQALGLLGGIFLAGTAVGVVGGGYRFGWPGAWLDVSLGLGFAVLAFTLLHRLRASGHATVGAVLRQSFGPAVATLAGAIAAVSWLVLLAAFVSAAARSLQELTGWGERAAVVGTVPILLLYALPGGVRAVATINLAQLGALGVVLGGLAVAMPAGPAPDVGGTSVPWGYIVALTLLSAPTTVVAPDVLLGVASLRDEITARRTVAVVAAALIVGGFFLAYIGNRARSLVEVGTPDQVLPRLMDVVMPSPAGVAGLILLFGASLSGAVAELVVCTYLTTSRQAADGTSVESSAGAVRLRMALVAVLAGGLAIVYPRVVQTVVIAFRIFVPAVVPAVIAALCAWRVPPRTVLTGMVLGPGTSTAVSLAFPATQMSVADPVLWGVLVSTSILLWGRRAGARPRTIGDSMEPMKPRADFRRMRG